MSRAPWGHWADRLWEGLCRGLCEAGALLAMQNGLVVTRPHDAAVGPRTTSGV